MHELQAMMQKLVGIVRQEEEMAQAIEELQHMRQRATKVGCSSQRQYNPGWHTCLDLEHLLTVSECIARAAIERKESRGAHFREDFPEKSAEWAQYNLIAKKADGGRVIVEKRPVIAMTADHKQVVEENK